MLPYFKFLLPTIIQKIFTVFNCGREPRQLTESLISGEGERKEKFTESNVKTSRSIISTLKFHDLSLELQQVLINDVQNLLTVF